MTIAVENEYEAEGEEGKHATPPGAGIGRSYVRRRLAVRCGDEASFDAHAENAIFGALRLPCEPMAIGSIA